MHFIITKDLINTAPGEKNRVGFKRANKVWQEEFKAATPEFKESMLAEFKAKMTDEFQLFDDDDNLYYEGLCHDLDNAEADAAFYPLDWAMNDVGATTMKTRKIGATKWEVL
jgi:hypothetical protein